MFRSLSVFSFSYAWLHRELIHIYTHWYTSIRVFCSFLLVTWRQFFTGKHVLSWKREGQTWHCHGIFRLSCFEMYQKNYTARGSGIFAFLGNTWLLNLVSLTAWSLRRTAMLTDLFLVGLYTHPSCLQERNQSAKMNHSWNTFLCWKVHGGGSQNAAWAATAVAGLYQHPLTRGCSQCDVRLVTSCHILSHLVTSCHILSHLVTSCHILSHLVTSCHILSHLVTFQHLPFLSFKPIQRLSFLNLLPSLR